MPNMNQFVDYELPDLPSFIALVGEAPGADEVRQGRPFIGKSGQILNTCLEKAGLSREDVPILNTFRYRPPSNNISLFFRTEADGYCCKDYPKYGNGWVDEDYAPELENLAKTLKKLKVRVAVALGNTPLWALTGMNGGITRVHGKLMDSTLVQGMKVMPAYHPAYIARGGAKREVLIKDLERAVTAAERRQAA